uniref:Uncharacterized protein n=1 Tax=viral metagenome TaxID=1070528 RepID=A0A6C0CI65_9ZZZZ
MAGAWLAHVKKTMKSMAGQKKSMGKKWFSHVLKAAKKTYKKHGGADSDSDDDKKSFGPMTVRRGGDDDKKSFGPMTVRKTRGGRRTRRHSRK